MANFVKHCSCPKCGSKDNVGLYDDGSEWCWGCGYYKPPAGLARIRSVVRPQDRQTKGIDLELPTDVTYRILPEHLDWLRKYGITTKEIITHKIMSSPSAGLILPIYDSTGKWLRFFISRPMKVGHPKSIDHGNKPFVLFGDREKVKRQDVVVIVEDYISAMKVARNYFAIPLFGSNLSLENVNKLKGRFAHVVFWLDPDKYLQAVRMMTRYQPYLRGTVVRSDKDPKEHSDVEIVKFVGESI